MLSSHSAHVLGLLKVMAAVSQIRPKQATLRLAAVLFDFALGALAGGALAFGPGTVPPPGVLLAALAGGSVAAIFCRHEQIKALRLDTRTAHRRRCRLAIAHVGVAVAILGATGAQLYATGFFSPLSHDRVAGFERLWSAIARSYPYFDLKGVDWDAVHDRYRPLVGSAGEDDEYFVLVASMLAELNDGHAELITPALFNGCYAVTEEMEGEAVVTWASLCAKEVGLDRGAVIISVDGLSVQETIGRLKPYQRTGSTPWQQRYNAFQFLLRAPSDRGLDVEFTTAAGQYRYAILTPRARRPGAPQRTPTPEPGVTYAVLPSGVGLVRVPSFERANGQALIDGFDEALDNLADAPGLILDLRGNGGGSPGVAEAMAGRLVSESFTYGREYYSSRIPQRGWRAWWDYTLEPREPVYTGPVVLLVDAGSMSAAEMLVSALADSGRAQMVGRRTAGSAGNPITFNLPGGGVARFSTGDFRRAEGTRIEGTGILPDVVVSWAIEDVRSNRDPDVQTAEEMILQSLPR